MARRRYGLMEGAAFYAAITIASGLAFKPPADIIYYEGQSKPRWAPPSWLFGLAWPVLNAAQIAGDVQLVNDRTNPDRPALLTLRGLNWLLYLAFTPAYFRARSPVLAATISVADAAVAYATVAVARHRQPATFWGTLPLAGWLTYAALLSVTVASRNRDPIVDGTRAALR